jgi:hypothetical protein
MYFKELSIEAASISRRKETQMKAIFAKRSAFVIIATIAMFTVVAMASASDNQGRKAIHGEYAFSGSGACTLAPGGFNPDFTPVNPTMAGMGPNFWEGVYTFKKDGKGKMESRQVYQEGPSNPPNTYAAGRALLSWEFEYEMAENEITFTLIPGTYYLEYTEGPNDGLKVETGNTVVFDHPWTGRISPDGRNLFVFYGVPMKLIIPAGILFPGAPMFEIICNGVHQGFKTHY